MPGFGFGTRVTGRVPAARPAPQLAHGRTAGYDAGTAGDYFVDGVNGLDTNPGTSPGAAFKTVTRAATVALTQTGARTIRVVGDGVRYRERVFVNWNIGALTSLTIAAYGTDLPYISGADVLTGFSACTGGDAGVVGANWPNIHKATIATSAVAHTEYWRTMLSEAETPLKLAVLRANDSVPAFFIDSKLPMYSDAALADLTMAVNPTYYSTITHPSVLGAYTDAQLAGTVASVHAYPNLTAYIRVASVSSGVLTLAANTLRPDAAGAGSYALLNVLPAIERGGWGYKDNGDGTVTFYVWPNDPANLAGGIEIAVRKDALYVNRSAEGRALTIDGLGFEMTSSAAADVSSAPLFMTSGVTTPALVSPTTVRQCHVRRFDGVVGGVVFKFLSNVTFEDSTIETGRTFGMVSQTITGGGSTRYRIERVLARDVSQTGFRIFGLRDSAVVDCKSMRTSSGGHANAINFYGGCDRVALVRFVGGYAPAERLYSGYGTHQASSRLLFLNCVFPMHGDGRGFVDQTLTGNAGPGAAAGDFAIVNCWTPHEPPLAGGGTPGFVLGRSSGGLTWQAYNNVTPNISAGGAGNTITRKNNVLTRGSAVAADASETVADYPAVYVDAASGNFAAAGGSVLATNTGFDVESLIAAWEAILPGVELRQDVLRRPWDPAMPGVGPFGREWAG